MLLPTRCAPPNDAARPPQPPEARATVASLRVGLTGGLASGKSTVARWLAEHPGFLVVDADRLVARFHAPGGSGRHRGRCLVRRRRSRRQRRRRPGTAGRPDLPRSPGPSSPGRGDPSPGKRPLLGAGRRPLRHRRARSDAVGRGGPRRSFRPDRLGRGACGAPAPARPRPRHGRGVRPGAPRGPGRRCGPTCRGPPDPRQFGGPRRLRRQVDELLVELERLATDRAG